MTAMTEFQAYKMYLALKAHFQTEKYDVIEQRGRIVASHKNFLGSGKSVELRKLTKLYQDKEICDFMVANFTAGDHWGGVFDGNAGRQYQDWKRRVESLRYVFNQDLDTLAEQAQDQDWFSVEDGRHPVILRAFYGHKICLETLVILDALVGYRDVYDVEHAEMFMWSDTSRLIKKYRPFLKFDVNTYQSIYDQKRS